MRCLTLARALREAGSSSWFVFREHQGHLGARLQQSGFACIALPTASDARCHDWIGASWQQDADETAATIQREAGRADWVVVDHYGLDHRWHEAVRASTHRLLAIDDLANRRLNCDVLLDQNLYANFNQRYEGLVPAETCTLLGPAYALLRPEFAALRQTLVQRNGRVKRVLVFFGGIDATTEIVKAIEANLSLGNPFELDVVLGPAGKSIADMRNDYADRSTVTFHESVDDMAGMIARADLFIGAGGSTTWERCCLGTPSIVIAVAQNQEAIAEGCAEAGAAMYLGVASDVTTDVLAGALKTLIQNPDALVAMSRSAMQLVDGHGASRVAAALANVPLVANA